MKVLFAIKSMCNPGGGAERVLAEVASGLVARGCQVGLLTFDKPGVDVFYTLDPRIEFIAVGIGSTTSRTTIKSMLRRMPVLRASVQKYAPDVVVGFMHSMYIPLGIALLGMSARVLASEHIGPAYYRARPVEALLFGMTTFLVDLMTIVSEQVLRSYPWIVRRKMVVATNPVGSWVQGRADVYGRGKQQKILLAVGRLEAQKDHVILIKAFAQIAEHVPDWVLRIVGDGGLRSTLSDMIRQAGLSDRIQLTGTSEEISRDYLNAQLFVQPSLYESLGLTVVEALLHGLPVVGFDDCQGVNELIRSGSNGELVSGGRSRQSALADVLLQLMQDDERRLRLSNGTMKNLSEYHIDNVVDRWQVILAGITGREHA